MTRQPSTIAAIIIADLTTILVAVYLARHRRHPPDVYVPQAAWLRAGIYFCACYLVAIATGMFDALLSDPIVPPTQIADPAWWAWIVGLTVLVTVAYWGIWARYTLRFDRRLDVIPQIVFGLFWGVASGLLFLSFYHVAQAVGRTWAPWQVWLLAYAAIGIWQWLWQDYGWDVYISPEHDSPWSIKIKTIATHIPNITACLIFFALYKNYAIFVALQTWALVGASIAMRMPAPWSRGVTPPATRSVGLFGLTRASGSKLDGFQRKKDRIVAEDTMRKDGKNMRPRLFDVRANDVSSEGVPVIQPWKRLVLDPDYAGAWILAGDVDGDGQVEIVSARNVDENDDHYTCSVVVHRLDGSVLWRWGNPSEGRNKLHHDVACQIYDWDGDGKAEVVIATREAIVELEGATGKEKRRFAIPRNASDCIVFANLSGARRASDILVKTRYGQIWAYSYDGQLLWTLKEPAGYKTAHQPRPIDVDGDGKDEILAGYALLNPDGTIRWDLQGQGLDLGRGHLDCARVFQMGTSPSDSSVILTFCGGNRIAVVDGTGNLIWSVTGHHFESVNVGKVCADVPGVQIVVDIDHRPWGESPLWVLDEHGNLLGQIITDSSRHHALIDWFGQGVESIVMGTAAAMFDGRGRKVAMFDASEVGLCSKGDMTGNGVPDLMFSSNPASEICVFKNEKGKKPEGVVALGTGVNFTLY